jgi:uncharacterized damage-inducible protein DinB
MAGIIVRVARDGIIYRGLVESYRANERMNQIVLQHLDPGAWRAKLPGVKGRTIADIFSHVHNIRRKWLRLSAPHMKLPLTLDRNRCTQEQASVALEESAARCCEMIAEALTQESSTAKFHRDGWAKPWPADASMVSYMIAHDAHHRGQVCMLAHQLGFPLPDKCTSAMWAWERF